MEPEHLRLSPEGAFPSRRGNGATLRLHLNQQGFWARLAGLAAGTDAYGAERKVSGERLAVVARLPSRLLVGRAMAPS
jgi:hypothetical protein